MSQQLRFAQVFFSYPDSPQELFEGIGFNLDVGWTGIVGTNGVGKSTILRLAAGELQPTAGTVLAPEPRVYAVQGAETPPAHWEEFMNDWEPPALELKERLAIDYDWLFRWRTLSQGERKRSQLAVALWLAPALLAVDEPTNHLDAPTRELIARGLELYDGVGLLVSHDRELLDRLCRHTLIVSEDGVLLRPGGYTKAREEEAREVEEARREQQDARRSQDRLLKEYQRRTAKASERSSGFSKAKLSWKDSDGRAAIDGARITGKDKRPGELKRQLEKRVERGEERLTATRGPIPVLSKAAGLVVRGAPAPGDELVHFEAGRILLGGDRWLEHPELTLRPTDRVRLQGRNGTGKSTLLRQILARLDRARVPTLYLPQELEEEGRLRLRRRVEGLSKEELSRVMAAVHWLGSDPRRIMDAEEWSPGEARKLIFALGAVDQPALYLLDEPTNHLDLPSILALEEALARVEAAILLVSHELHFAERISETSWLVEEGEEGACRLRLE